MIQRDATVNPVLPTMSPIDAARLVARPFDLQAAVLAIREAASFG